MYWGKDSQATSGGYWRCSVKAKAASCAWRVANREKVRATERRWRQNNREHDLERKRLWRSTSGRRLDLMRKYGITLEDYEAMFQAQGGVCAICFRPPNGRPLPVDHDHKTGKVRGLLCVNCNTTLGKLEESPEITARYIEYMQRDLAASR